MKLTESQLRQIIKEELNFDRCIDVVLQKPEVKEAMGWFVERVVDAVKSCFHEEGQFLVQDKVAQLDGKLREECSVAVGRAVETLRVVDKWWQRPREKR